MKWCNFKCTSVWNDNELRGTASFCRRLIFAQLTKKCPIIYGTRRLNTVFTRTRHWSSSWDWWNQSRSSHQFLWDCF